MNRSNVKIERRDRLCLETFKGVNVIGLETVIASFVPSDQHTNRRIHSDRRFPDLGQIYPVGSTVGEIHTDLTSKELTLEIKSDFPKIESIKLIS